MISYGIKKKKKEEHVSLDITGDRREVVKNIRFSKYEWEIIIKKMEECEIRDFSEYARLACLQVDPIIFDVETFCCLLYIRKDLKDFLTKIGEGELSGKDLDDAKKCFSHLNNYLKEYFPRFR